MSIHPCMRPSESGRHPFIVIEGLDGVGKSSIATQVSQRLGAALLSSPGAFGDAQLPVLGTLRAAFDASPAASRRAFYRFANLVVGTQAQVLSRDRPVVVDRYWPSTYSYSAGLAEQVDGLPAPGEYPVELRRPDVVVLVTADPATRRSRRRLRDSDGGTPEESHIDANLSYEVAIVECLRQFADAVVANDTDDLQATVEAVLQAVRRHLNHPA